MATAQIWQVAVLDEPSASLEPEFEDKMFSRCAAAGLTIVTVAHRRAVSIRRALDTDQYRSRWPTGNRASTRLSCAVVS